MDKLIVFLLYVVVYVFCILDYFHTTTLISVGLTETNPIVLYIVNDGKDWINLLIFKLALLTVLGVGLIFYLKKGEKLWK